MSKSTEEEFPVAEESDLKRYFRLLRYLKPYWPYFAFSIFGYLIFAASQPALAKLMEHVVEAINNKDVEARITLPLMAVGIFAIRGIGSFIGAYYNEFTGAAVVTSIKKEVFNHLTSLPADYFDNASQGQLLHRLTSGANSVQKVVTDALKRVISEGLTVIALLAYVFYLNWKLSVVFLLIAPCVLWIVNYSTKRLKDIARKNEGALGVAMQVVKEMISNHSVVRFFGAEQYERARYNAALDKVFKQQMRIRKIASIASPLLQLVTAIAVAAIVGLLLQPEILASYTTAELVGYLTAVALIPKPVKQLSGVGLIIQRGLIGAAMIFEILDTKVQSDDGTYEAESVEGAVRFDRVEFKYPGANSNAINGVDLEIEPGRMVALVGRSGSGKTTLVNLLMRLYDPSAGAIYLDGKNIADYKLENLRRHISIVSQHVVLFDDTIRNNIAYGDIVYTEEDLYAAIKHAHAEDFIANLPDGLDTMVGDNGLRLSGGQRQRIAIARAFLKNSPILIMDEATSALDNESEAAIKRAIEGITATRTSIVIAHRLSTIQKADKVVVMEEGLIIEQGGHDELSSLGGHYAKLINAGLV